MPALKTIVQLSPQTIPLYRAVEALNVAADEINCAFGGEPLVLNVTGLNTFGSRVLFASIAPDGEKQLKDMAGKYGHVTAWLGMRLQGWGRESF